MARFFVSDIYCPASLPKMTRTLLKDAEDSYKYAVIDEHEIYTIMERLVNRQLEIYNENKRLIGIHLYRPFNDQTRRYINVGEGHIALILVNERRMAR